jgi:hypothetical protein
MKNLELLRCSTWFVWILILGGVQGASAAPAEVTTTGPATSQPAPPPWVRRYTEGEKIVYHMRGTNRDREGTWVYAFDADAVVTKGTDGGFHEDYGWKNVVSMHTHDAADLFSLTQPGAWTDLVKGHKALDLPAASVGYRQRLALPAIAKADDFMKVAASMQDLSKVDASLVGPIADLTTFYVDLMFCSGFGATAKTGDRRYINSRGRVNSWADGSHVVLGADSIDFDCQVKEINREARTATLSIDHVPAKNSKIQLPAAWMKTPVSDAPNNWVEVIKNDDHTFTAAVGKETFAVTICVSLADGRILEARMDNQVDVLERRCQDAALTTAGEPVRYEIRRQIDLIDSSHTK